MDELTFQLEIPERWMLWRIYHVEGDADEDEDEDKRKVKDDGWDLHLQWGYYFRRGYGYFHHYDPMDKDDFDEAVSFPSIKPDRDLFGPPLRRSRKQRGWHHVKRWPPAVLVNTTPQHYATGADIPQELFDNILDQCEEAGYSCGNVKPLRLVCRRWEALSLRRMFRSITLRNHLEVNTVSTLLDQRMAHSRLAYPAQTITLNMELGLKEGWHPWVDLPRLLPKLQCDPRYYQTGWHIWGPLPAGRRLTSVYLSSPVRPHWRPLQIHKLSLHNIHFRKLDDLIRLLRELPSLTYVDGQNIRWDGEEYPRMTSFIPCSHPHSSIAYTFDSPELNRILVCALSLSGSRPVAQSDADILYGLVSVLKPAREYRNPTRFKSCLNISCKRPWPGVHVAFRPTREKTQSVQSIAFDFAELEDVPVYMDKGPWDSTLGFVEKLVRDTRPEILFLFPSTESTASFLDQASIFDLAPFIASGRVKCVIESEEKQTVKLVKPDGNGGCRELATRLYQIYHNNCDRAGSRGQVLHELGAWSAVNARY